jgi:hypothetical protein
MVDQYYWLHFQRPPRETLAAFLEALPNFWCVESYSGLFTYVTVPCERDPVWDLVVGIDDPTGVPQVSVGVFTPAGEALLGQFVQRLSSAFGAVAIEEDFDGPSQTEATAVSDGG